MRWIPSPLLLRHNTKARVSLKSSISSPLHSPNTSATLSTLPEEIRQQIVSYLDYHSAWALKQTSILFLQVVEIPTIASFLACPDGTSLARLEKCKIIRGGLELCFYCHHLLRADKFSFFQRRITAARQMSLGYDYQSWKPEKHFCIDCGLKHHQYALGRPIDVGWVSGEAAIIPCQHCSEQFDSREVACTLCLGCPSCIAIAQKAFSDKEVPVAFISDEFCGHKAMIDSCKAFRAYGFGGSGEETLLEINGPEPEGDPDLVEYGNKPLHEILDFVGEKVKSVYCVETESG